MLVPHALSSVGNPLHCSLSLQSKYPHYPPGLIDRGAAAVEAGTFLLGERHFVWHLVTKAPELQSFA